MGSPSPTPLKDIRQRITNECSKITPEMLEYVRERFEKDLYDCVFYFPAFGDTLYTRVGILKKITPVIFSLLYFTLEIALMQLIYFLLSGEMSHMISTNTVKHHINTYIIIF